ncbi:hypothetical protein BGZ65_001134 [Modicella reniformis]|uniref:Uncharacterized protein n=1 Tax=Modicella reniformis TaxID=1440133 RepID=A0A9P6MA38_9FUNG|nr:hypothetical protein BGZ65_001134 [Modicella reniformis]
MSWFYDQWEIHDFEFLNKNSGLKFLRGTDWFRFSGVLYNDAFSNLKQLENLRYMTNGDGGSHQQLFQPISATLKSLHLMCHRGSLDLHGLVFPNMTELEIDLSDPHDTMNILQACPQLESLGLPSSGTERAVNHLIQALNSGTLCPTLKILKLKVKSLQTEDFARMIESRSGLETLHLELQSAGVRVAIAINHQASSLTHLRIRRTGNDSIMPFMLAVVGSCGQLKDVMVDEVRAEAIDGLMSKDSWMNPDGLENLTLSGTPLSLCGEELTKLVEKPASDPLRLPIDGWKISSQAKKVIRDKSYLTTLFQFAQGFGRLRAITINDVVYHKVSAQ